MILELKDTITEGAFLLLAKIHFGYSRLAQAICFLKKSFVKATLLTSNDLPSHFSQFQNIMTAARTTSHNSVLEPNISQYTFQQSGTMESPSIQHTPSSAFSTTGRKTLLPSCIRNATGQNGMIEARNANGLSRLVAMGKKQIVTPQISPRAAESHHNSQSQYFRAPPYSSIAQHPCSCQECAHHYWQYYNAHYGSYGYYHQPCHPHEATRVTGHERPTFHRRVSTESPPQTFASRDEGKRSLKRNDAPEYEAADASDREVAMITSRCEHPHPNHYAYPHISRRHYHHHHPSYLPYHHYPYNGYHPYYDKSYNHPAASDNMSRRKKTKYDEFLLRPQKDYVIYADRSNSRMSDITASPTPSLSDFESCDMEDLEKHDARKFATDVPPVLAFNPDFELPRLKRRRIDMEGAKFDVMNEGDEIVRTVSPAKSKEHDTMKKVIRDDQVWRAKSGNDSFGIPILKNVSHSFCQ